VYIPLTLASLVLQTKEQSTTIVLGHYYTTSMQWLALRHHGISLRKEAAEFLKAEGPVAFAKKYGDFYIAGVKLGGSLHAGTEINWRPMGRTGSPVFFLQLLCRLLWVLSKLLQLLSLLGLCLCSRLYLYSRLLDSSAWQ
jgi:hypothetical protein